MRIIMLTVLTKLSTSDLIYYEKQSTSYKRFSINKKNRFNLELESVLLKLFIAYLTAFHKTL